MDERIRSSAIKTGYLNLDKWTGGLQKREITVVGSRPAIGKTAFALNLLKNIAINGSQRCLYITMEDSVQKLTERLIRIVSQISFMSSTDCADLIERTTRQIGDAPIMIESIIPESVDGIAQYVRSNHLKNDIDLLIIDYLQLLFGEKANRQESDSTQDIRVLKELAEELDISVLALSQLDRKTESRPMHKPTFSDLKGLSEIEDVADAILLLYRDDYYYRNSKKNGIMEIIVKKNTSDICETIELRYDKHCGKIEEIS